VHPAEVVTLGEQAADPLQVPAGQVQLGALASLEVAHVRQRHVIPPRLNRSEPMVDHQGHRKIDAGLTGDLLI
jgi:hypothetical protein